MDLKGKKVVVVGLGVTGRDTARFLRDRGAQVWVTESRDEEQARAAADELRALGIRVEIGGHTEEFCRGAALVVPSPGVPPEALPLRVATAGGVPVVSEIELAFQETGHRRIIAITGTNGKTTTTALVGHLLSEAGMSAAVCGNIGNTFIAEATRLTAETWAVIEVSSFQLEHIDRFSPRIGVCLNVTPDHLDRYQSMEEYFRAKARLFARQEATDWAVLNKDSDYCRRIWSGTKARVVGFSRRDTEDGVFLSGTTIVSCVNGPREIADLSETRLIGAGNAENMLACAAVGLILGISPATIRRALQTFQPLAHRMEVVRHLDGVAYVNDSKSTTPDSVRNALESFPQAGKVVLILGGRGKGCSFEGLAALVTERVKCLILIGESAEQIGRDLAGTGVPAQTAATLQEAVAEARRVAAAGDVVLL